MYYKFSFLSLLLPGNGLGWKGFYPTSMCEHARKGGKTMIQNVSEGWKLGLLFGDYVKVGSSCKSNNHKCEKERPME